MKTYISMKTIEAVRIRSATKNEAGDWTVYGGGQLYSIPSATAKKHKYTKRHAGYFVKYPSGEVAMVNKAEFEKNYGELTEETFEQFASSPVHNDDAAPHNDDALVQDNAADARAETTQGPDLHDYRRPAPIRMPERPDEPMPMPSFVRPPPSWDWGPQVPDAPREPTKFVNRNSLQQAVQQLRHTSQLAPEPHTTPTPRKAVMSATEALEAADAGHRVARAAWLTGTELYQVKEHKLKATFEPFISLFGKDRDVMYKPRYEVQDAAGYVYPWIPSDAGSKSHDWYIVE